MTIDLSTSPEPSSSSSTLVPDDYQVDPDNYWVFGYGSLIYKPPPYTQLRVPGYITGYVRRFWQSSNDHRGTPEAPGRVVTLIEHNFWKSLTTTSDDNKSQNTYTQTVVTNTTTSLDPHAAPPNGKTWGVAYKIQPQHARAVKEYLDYREKNGYTEHRVAFTVDSKFLHDHNKNSALNNSSTQSDVQITLDPVFMCHVYIGTPDNDAFVGPQHPEALAKHIVNSSGPSGENKEYLYNLHNSLQILHKLNPTLETDDTGTEYQWPEDEHITDLVRLAKKYDQEKTIH